MAPMIFHIYSPLAYALGNQGTVNTKKLHINSKQLPQARKMIQNDYLSAIYE
jgi:hypothetical protein